MTENVLLKDISENSVVLMELFGSIDKPAAKQFCKIYNIKFIPKDEKCSFDCEVLYTNFRMHKSMLNSPMGNCLSITEIIPNEMNLDLYASSLGLWKADLHSLSDNELKQKRSYYESNIFRH